MELKGVLCKSKVQHQTIALPSSHQIFQKKKKEVRSAGVKTYECFTFYTIHYINENITCNTSSKQLL